MKAIRPLNFAVLVMTLAGLVFGAVGAELQTVVCNADEDYQATVAYAFGDSITMGQAASAPACRYTNIFAAYMGWTLSNQGIGGYTSLEMPHCMYMFAPASTYYSFGFIGVNDLARIQADAAFH